MLGEPTLTHRPEGGHDIPLLVWRLPTPARSISSAVLGGGIGECRWIINASVPMSYDRDDPATHLTELAAGLGLSGPGVGLLTGVDVADAVAEADGGVRLWATVGLGAPIQAAHQLINDELPRATNANSSPSRREPAPTREPGPSEAAAVQQFTNDELGSGAGTNSSRSGGEPVPGREPVPGGESASGGDSASSANSSRSGHPRPGTVNVVVWVPQRLSDAALVNAVATITEAKTQAIRDLGLAATGTATDAVCVLCPQHGDTADYGGPRSTSGAPLARAAYRAVLKGGEINLAGTQSWSERIRR